MSGWRKLNNTNFLKPKDFKKGEVMLEGTFLGRRPTQYGEALDFSPSDGTSTVSLHGYQPIIQQMESVEPNTLCRVTYEGQKKSKNKLVYHNFSVEVSEEESLVTTTPAKKTAGAKKKPLTDDTLVENEDEEVDDIEDDFGNEVEGDELPDDDLEETEDLEDEEEEEEVVKPKATAKTSAKKAK